MNFKPLISCATAAVVLFVVAVAVFHTPLSYATAADGQTGLPPEVQADLLRNKIFAALNANDLSGALVAIDQYKALKVDFPPALFFVEARAAERTGDPERALAALDLFMKSADRKSKQYQQALALYPSYASAAEASAKAKANSEAKEKALAEAAAKLKAGADAKAKEARALEERPQKILNLVEDITSTMINIPGGTFEMGSSVDTSRSSRPLHTVRVRPFRVTPEPITCSQYIRYTALLKITYPYCSGASPSLSWNDGKQFLDWLRQESHLDLRILSEAEWEWMARNRKGSSKTSIYNQELAARNGLGFEVAFLPGWDVGEWVADCQHLTYSGAPSDSKAWTDGGDCTRRVMRGSYPIDQVLHHALVFGSNNYYTYNDSSFIGGRLFGLANQVCGGKTECSFRVAADE